MGIKKYIVASIILLISIAGYIYFGITTADYKVEIIEQITGYSKPILIVVLVIAPAIVLFIATILHMFYFSLKGLIISRGIQKDNENILSLLNKRLLGETSKKEFKSIEAKAIGEILSQLNIQISDTDFSSSNDKVNTTAQNIININAGKYVSSKELTLSSNNPLMQKNIKNKIDIDDNFALEIVKQQSTNTIDVFKHAFVRVVETKSMTIIKKLLEEITLDLEMLKVLIKKDSEDSSELSLDNTTLLKILRNIELTNKDLIFISREYKNSMAPEQLLKLIEDIITNNEKLSEGYLYMLAEYEMIDEMREILASSQKDEFKIYKAYLDLKDSGKHYPLDTFL